MTLIITIDHILFNVLIQEKQLKKVRAKQKRLQAILGGEDTQRVEAELLAECDEDEGWCDRSLLCCL